MLSETEKDCNSRCNSFTPFWTDKRLGLLAVFVVGQDARGRFAQLVLAEVAVVGR